MVVDDTTSTGSVYTGRMVNGTRDGSGTCKWTNGKTYVGGWKNGQMHGRGVYTWTTGVTYEGERHKGCADGWGVLRHPDGGSYEGLWRDSQWKRGTFHHCNRVDVWDGEWVWNATASQCEMKGWGVQRKRTNNNTGTGNGGGATVMETVYEGGWDRDQWHGVGTWRSPDGSGAIYHGQFDHGKKCGTGRILFGDGGGNNNNNNSQGGGGSYVGEWKDDMFHGRGVRLWANGDRYDGQWVCGMENGEGTKMWSRDGSSFTGLWESGVPTKGTRRWLNGDTFEGTFNGGDGRNGWECRGEGVATLSSPSSILVKGTLNNNRFQSGNFSEVQHLMGSSQFEHHLQIEPFSYVPSSTESHREKKPTAC
ncbi:2-isopropylmalate synthase [Pelomyxa schiedti]|nr:2-isopropylmalate synthase [Pelomyxa schiedti]